MEKTFYWISGDVANTLHSMLRALGEEYPIQEGKLENGIQISFEKVDKEGFSETTINDDKALIKYSSVSTAARGIGSILSGLDETGKTSFKTLGIMLDCSRNAVMKGEHFKKWLRRLSLMGYNMAMLYTEDTYQLPDEPYFGYMRGGYTMDEIKELDAYAASLGIEMIGCIQTLGHLEQILRWDDYRKVKDTGGVMLVDEGSTYNLIDKMLAFWGEALSSRRIHIGMDETHDLGRGGFMDRNGYQRGFDIFNRHLAKVNGMCTQHGLKAMIWSDMFFRMGSKTGDYYDEATVIPNDVKEMIPTDVDLVYWDYYHDNKEFYVDWINRHRDLGFEPPLGSGIWTWTRLWYDHVKTVETVKPCIEASLETGLSELFFTMWGDDGAYCEFDSAMAGLCYAAELAFSAEGDNAVLNQKFKAICGESFDAFVKVGELESDNDDLRIQAPAILWDDPLLGIHWKDKLIDSPTYWDGVIERYNGIAEELNAHQKESYSEVLEHGCIVTKTLLAKIELRKKLVEAYGSENKEQLIDLKNNQLPKMIEDVKELKASMRKQWLRRNKVFGFETIQNRLNILSGRYEEIADRIDELLSGEITNIPELDPSMKTEVKSGAHTNRHLLSGSSIV